MKSHFPSRQGGMTLLVGLILLVLLMLMAATAFNLSRTNTAVTANMQSRMQAGSAATAAIEQTISTAQFTQTPDNAIAGDTCGTNKICFDVNGDSTSDISVELTPPPCIKKAQPIKNASLDLTDPLDAPCAIGASQTFGVTGSATGNSLCSQSVWEVTAEATDSVTSTKAVVVTGVGVRTLADDAADPAKICK